jgi:programmed cell death 6-interacting protein
LIVNNKMASSSSAASRMIVVPYKRPFDLDISHNIKSFLDNTYAGNPNLAEFKQSVDSLNLLRNEALFRAARQEKLNKLMRYHDQLQAIETKIPISENMIRILFKWQDAFDKGSLFVGKSSFSRLILRNHKLY